MEAGCATHPMVIHFGEEHGVQPQELLFRILSKHNTPLDRQVQESVNIEYRSMCPSECLNLKNEWAGSKLPGLMIQRPKGEIAPRGGVEGETPQPGVGTEAEVEVNNSSGDGGSGTKRVRSEPEPEPEERCLSGQDGTREVEQEQAQSCRGRKGSKRRRLQEAEVRLSTGDRDTVVRGKIGEGRKPRGPQGVRKGAAESSAEAEGPTHALAVAPTSFTQVYMLGKAPSWSPGKAPSLAETSGGSSGRVG